MDCLWIQPATLERKKKKKLLKIAPRLPSEGVVSLSDSDLMKERERANREEILLFFLNTLNSVILKDDVSRTFISFSFLCKLVVGDAQWVRPWTIREIGQVMDFDLKYTVAFLGVYSTYPTQGTWS